MAATLLFAESVTIAANHRRRVCVPRRQLCYRTRMPVEETKVVSAKSSVSSRIIAAGIVIAFCYWASTVLVTLLVAVLMAYFLDPVVTWLERMRIPRALGSLIVVLVTIAMLSVVAYSLIDRADQFGRDWPKYREPLRAASAGRRIAGWSRSKSTFRKSSPREKPASRS